MACDSPVFVRSKGQEIPVPCGRCAPCKSRRVREWIFRMMWEERHNAVSSHFVTLTYDTAHVPLTPHGFMSLCKQDLQKFFKRLRKLTDNPIKYYAVGEYGGTSKRPHYHAIVFNVPDADMFAKAWSLDGVQFGGVDVGTVTEASVGYTMKYIQKDNYKASLRAKFARDDRVQEFSLMSKGIGKGYLDQPGIRSYHTSDLSLNYVTSLDGYKVPMPRYYRKQLYDDDQLQEQRDIINVAVEQNQQKMRYQFVSSVEFPTLADRIEAEKQGRKIKLQRSLTSRNKI